MKRIPQLGFIFALAFLVGCANLERNTYRTLGAVAITVDAAMTSWGDWVRAGRATQGDEDTVRNLYGNYQNSMRIAQGAVNVYRLDPNAAQLDKAVNAVSAIAQDLTEFIYGFVSPKKDPPK